jgi:hypothetical protein
MSEIKRSHAVWVYLFPLQSASQFMSFLIASFIGIMIAGAIIGVISHDGLNINVVIVGFFGALPFLYFSLPAEFTISTNESWCLNAWERELSERIVRRSYILVDDQPNKKIFKPKKMLGIPPYKESNITIFLDGNQLRVVGPKISISTLHSYANKLSMQNS